MMGRGSVRAALPYVVGLGVAVLLLLVAMRIEYTPRPGQLGPDFWPKLAIGLMALVCLVEILRALLGAGEAQGLAEVLEGAEAEDAGKSAPALLLGGIALVLAYAVLVPWLGFLLATFLFIVAFMYLGCYRNHAAIWSIAVAATILIAFLFLRFAYVSLPRGEPPFDRFTDLLRVMLGG